MRMHGPRVLPKDYLAQNLKAEDTMAATIYNFLDFSRKAAKKTRNSLDQMCRDRAKSAWDCYQEASRIDEDHQTYDEAIRLYRRAIFLDPNLDIAYTNLGNCYFHKGDKETAKVLYDKALTISPKQPEALYNLGYLFLEEGNPEKALDLLLFCLEQDESFADAHFNAAMALERLGDFKRAKIHWVAYIEIEPKGTWTDIARRHLND